MRNMRKWTTVINMVTSLVLCSLILCDYNNKWLLLVVAVITCMANNLDGWTYGWIRRDESK